MSERIAAFGTQLKIGDGVTPTEGFTTIAGVRDITGPTFSAQTIDGKAHDSAGNWNELIPTFLEGGEVSMELAFDPVEATHRDVAGGLLNDFTTRTKRNFELHFTDVGATKWSFSAFVTGFQPGAPLEGLLTASVTLTITGQPTLA